VKDPPGEMLQPEATGAVMEVTKWLKPLVQRVTKYGDVASVRAVTRVNTEQSSKRTMCRPTRLLKRGRLIWLDGTEQSGTARHCTGALVTARIQGKRTQHGKPYCVV